MFCNTKIGTFIHENKDWEQKLTQKPYCLLIKRLNPYILFKYSQIDSDFTNPVVREARGIIFREGDWEQPVCHAFDKFGNYQENYSDTIDWNTAVVTEKIDGSLIKVWHDGCWHISTNGTISAYTAQLHDNPNKSYADLFIEAIEKCSLQPKPTEDSIAEFFCNLDPNFTYIFELVSPENRVVIPYKTTRVYFLAARNNCTNQLFFKNPNAKKTHSLDILQPKRFSLKSLSDCVKTANEFNWDQEGFVVHDFAGHMIKIKSPEYVRAHYARNNNNMTDERLLDVVRQNESEEFLTYCSDYTKRLKSIEFAYKQFQDFLKTIVICINKVWENFTLEKTKKEFSNQVRRYPKVFQSYLFYCWNEGLVDFNNIDFGTVTSKKLVKDMKELKLL
jgi:T4 RnlA family RNA ligase